MRKIIIIGLFIIARINFICAQQSISLPDYYYGTEIFYDSSSSNVDDSTFIVFGYYESKGIKYYAPIISSSSIDKNKWIEIVKDSQDNNPWLLYYNQLSQFSFRAINNDHVLLSNYSDSLNYISWYDDNKDTFRLDSVKQASSINDLALSNDSLMDANITNNEQNFIVRKKGINGDWLTMPVIIYKPSSFIIYLQAFIIIAVIGAFIFTIYLYAEAKQKVRNIHNLIKKAMPEFNQLKLDADKPLTYDQLTKTDELKKKNKDILAAIDAITSVIKNRQTPLPMTIAINGAWGSGKSSIMNCIRELLDSDENERFITTWFNAWHQQTESSLLNAFLLKIINRYEKPFFKNNRRKASSAYFRFRFRLGYARFIKWPFYTQLLSGFAIGFLVLSVLIIVVNIYHLLGWINIENWGLLNFNLLDFFGDNEFNSFQTWTQAILAIILPIISFFFLKSESKPTLGAFLNVIYKDTFLLEAERNSPDLREKFRSQYWEIMKAVGSRVLVVFIDDIDRINGDKIFEMMEAINFIGDVTSRPDDYNDTNLNTVFVLGLYIDQVAEHLGLFLQKEKSFSNKIEPDLDEAKVLGKRYIEKMIQLNVPVPLTKEQSKKA